MTMPHVSLRADTCTQTQIATHLHRCDALFVPPLGSRVDIPEYASKLHAKATRFEAWCDTQLVGLVAVYFNCAASECFITSVSVVPDYQGRNLAFDLLLASRDAAKNRGMMTMLLEVSVDNTAAIGLYRRLGYITLGQCDGILRMQQEINQKHLDKTDQMP